MHGVESIGSAHFINQVRGVAGTEDRQSTTNQDWKRAGLEGALKLSGDFLKQTMTEIGFIDIHASGTDKMKTFVSHISKQEQETQVSLDPVTAAEMAVLAGAQVLQNADLALRTQAQVDPIRVAALLK